MSFDFRYRILLLEIGPNRLRVLAFLRELIGLPHSEVKAFVANLPITVVEDGDRVHMMRLAADLSERGAVVQIEICPPRPPSTRRSKELVARVEFDMVGGQETPRPPIGSTLKPYGVNVGQFICNFNERTRCLNGKTVRVSVSIYCDGSFTFAVDAPTEANGVE